MLLLFMKNIKINVLKIVIVTVLLPAVLIGCKKDEVVIEPIIKTEKISEMEFSKLTQFISVTTGAPKSEIFYSEKGKEYIVYGWFHKSLADAQSEYDMANEYKATYEK
jgi:hypothetical protein